MPKLLWSFLCEKPIVDSQTNQISLINIVEQLNVPKVPTILPFVYYVVTLWEKNVDLGSADEIFQHRIQISPQSESLAYTPYEYESRIPADKLRLRTCNGIGGIPVGASGKLFFHIEQKKDGSWQEIMKFEIEVYLTK